MREKDLNFSGRTLGGKVVSREREVEKRREVWSGRVGVSVHVQR